MTWRERYAVILVKSTAYAIRAEQVLNMSGIACKLIPVPRHLSSNCGTCVRIERTDIEAAKTALTKNRVEYESVHEI